MKIKSAHLILLFVLVITIGLFVLLSIKNSPFVLESNNGEEKTNTDNDLNTDSDSETDSDPKPKDFDGVRLGELAKFNFVSIKPISVEEDSRCPIDVTCIHAGTIRLKIEATVNSNIKTTVLTLGEEITIDGVGIVLTKVMPDNISQKTISAEEYRFIFSVIKKDSPTIGNKGKCYVGGCSGQICSDRPDAISTCEYKEEYACYKSAVCERQSNGECGWTSTPELKVCLESNS